MDHFRGWRAEPLRAMIQMTRVPVLSPTRWINSAPPESSMCDPQHETSFPRAYQCW